MWLNLDVLPSPLNQGKEEENRKGAQALEKEEIIIGGWVDRESEDRGENEEWQGKKIIVLKREPMVYSYKS